MTFEEFKIWFDGLIAGMPKPENVCSYNVYHDLVLKIKEKMDSVEPMAFYGKIDTRTGKAAL